MTMAVADDDGKGRQQWRQTRTAADDNGVQDGAADYGGEGQEQAANNNGIRHKAT
jgi:hypothetical protein